MYIPHLKKYMTQEQLEELKSEINKTDYEKAREPLEKEVGELHNKIFELEEINNALKKTLCKIVESLELDYIKLYVIRDPIEVKFGTTRDITESNYETINVPIKDMLMFEIKQEIANLLNNGSDKE